MRDALCRTESYAHGPAEVQVRETHISWWFLAGELAYKLKKPLVLGFLDYGSPERRRAMCEAEVRLNRRLARDIYLGVRGVAITDGGVELTRVRRSTGCRLRRRDAPLRRAPHPGGAARAG